MASSSTPPPASSQLDVRFNNTRKHFERVSRSHVYVTIRKAASRVLEGKADGLDLHALMLGTAGFVALSTDVLPAVGQRLKELKARPFGGRREQQCCSMCSRFNTLALASDFEQRYHLGRR